MVTLPDKTNANAADNTTTSLTENTAVQWLVVELDGDDAQNRAKISAVPADEPYVKYRLQKSWRLTTTGGVRGQNVIWDLNGYTLSVDGGSYIQTSAMVLEVTDSSASGNGVLTAGAVHFNLAQIKQGRRRVILSGGKMTGGSFGLNYGESVDLIVTNGSITKTSGSPFYLGGNNSYTVITTPDATTTTNSAGEIIGVIPVPKLFAVSGSTSALVSGEHNYEFTEFSADIGAGESVLESLAKMPHTPHYLYYRASADQPYQMLATL